MPSLVRVVTRCRPRRITRDQLLLSSGVFRLLSVSRYVEKNTRGCSVPVTDLPSAIGAGLAETGCFFASAISNCSTLRCSCKTEGLARIMGIFFHSPCALHSWRISNGGT